MRSPVAKPAALGLVGGLCSIPVALFAESITPLISFLKGYLLFLLPVLACAVSFFAAIYLIKRSVSKQLTALIGIKAALLSLTACAAVNAIDGLWFDTLDNILLGLLLNVAWAFVLFGCYATLLGALSGWLLSRTYTG